MTTHIDVSPHSGPGEGRHDGGAGRQPASQAPGLRRVGHRPHRGRHPRGRRAPRSSGARAAPAARGARERGRARPADTGREGRHDARRPHRDLARRRARVRPDDALREGERVHQGDLGQPGRPRCRRPGPRDHLVARDGRGRAHRGEQRDARRDHVQPHRVAGSRRRRVGAGSRQRRHPAPHRAVEPGPRAAPCSSTPSCGLPSPGS